MRHRAFQHTRPPPPPKHNVSCHSRMSEMVLDTRLANRLSNRSQPRLDFPTSSSSPTQYIHVDPRKDFLIQMRAFRVPVHACVESNNATRLWSQHAMAWWGATLVAGSDPAHSRAVPEHTLRDLKNNHRPSYRAIAAAFSAHRHVRTCAIVFCSQQSQFIYAHAMWLVWTEGCALDAYPCGFVLCVCRTSQAVTLPSRDWARYVVRGAFDASP